MNAQEAIEKRLKEINETIKNYEEHIERLERMIAESTSHSEQSILARSIDNKGYHLHGLLESKRELEAILDVSAGSDREN